MYVVEEKLDSKPSEKITSGAISLVLTALLIGLLWFMKISLPNPPFETKKEGVVELDLGMIDGGYGNPNDGGPSLTPPAQGDNSGDDGGTPTPTGGEGRVITNAGENTVKLPATDPPKRSEDPEEAALKARLKIGKRTGSSSSSEGNPNGWPGGTGRTGSGGGTNTGGVRGDGTGSNPGNRGKGLVSAYFTNFRLQSDVEEVKDAQGFGDIVYEVKVECDGSFKILPGEVRGFNYNGGDAKRVFTEVLNRSSFRRLGETCPETGKVAITIKKR
jgi:hypothetical protein